MKPSGQFNFSFSCDKIKRAGWWCRLVGLLILNCTRWLGATAERARRRRFRSISEGGCFPGDALADTGTAVRWPTAFRRHDLQGANHPVRAQSSRVHRRVSYGRRNQDITEPTGLVHRVDRSAQQQREHAQFAARHYGWHRRDQGQKGRLCNSALDDIFRSSNRVHCSNPCMNNIKIGWITNHNDEIITVLSLSLSFCWFNQKIRIGPHDNYL